MGRAPKPVFVTAINLAIDFVFIYLRLLGQHGSNARNETNPLFFGSSFFGSNRRLPSTRTKPSGRDNNKSSILGSGALDPAQGGIIARTKKHTSGAMTTPADPPRVRRRAAGLDKPSRQGKKGYGAESAPTARHSLGVRRLAPRRVRQPLQGNHRVRGGKGWAHVAVNTRALRRRGHLRPAFESRRQLTHGFLAKRRRRALGTGRTAPGTIWVNRREFGVDHAS